MTYSIPARPRVTPIQWVARGLMATLWAAGSAYLIAHVLAQPQPNWIEIVTIPALWAAVIAAPIIAHHAIGNRDHVAAALLTAASLIGSAWTLNGTIDRQSEGADERVAVAAQVEQQRRDLNPVGLGLREKVGNQISRSGGPKGRHQAARHPLNGCRARSHRCRIRHGSLLVVRGRAKARRGVASTGSGRLSAADRPQLYNSS